MGSQNTIRLLTCVQLFFQLITFTSGSGDGMKYGPFSTRQVPSIQTELSGSQNEIDDIPLSMEDSELEKSSSILSSSSLKGGFTLFNGKITGLGCGGAIDEYNTKTTSNDVSAKSEASNGNEMIEVPISRVRSRMTLNPAHDTKFHREEIVTNLPESTAQSERIKFHGRPLKVLFLSEDTGGGHRASAESLAKQFERHYPFSKCDLVGLWTKDGGSFYSKIVPFYQHLSSHPLHWRLLFHISNTSPYLFLTNLHTVLTCERKIRKTIARYDADVVVSVHPAMQHVPLTATRNIAKKLGKKIPFVTVVTDFGSGHCLWFHTGVDKCYVASDRIRRLARRRGRLNNKKLVQIGLPIRVDFADQAKAMGDRNSEKGKAYQSKIRKQLGIKPEKKMVLVMGGGEGVGSLSSIVDSLYATFVKKGIDVTIVVVCGRNEKLKEDLKVRDWEKVISSHHNPSNKKFRPFNFISRAIPHRRRESLESYSQGDKGNVDVIGLGFVTNMAEYMVAADVLVTKAGPGTIAEAAAVGLPVMLTSHLPGQEAGNVDIVLDGGFGDYCRNPKGIAQEVSCWLKDEELLKIMSKGATAVGAPDAASDIVLDIGKLTEEFLDNKK